MKVYCMCRERNNKQDSQKFLAPNLFTDCDTETNFRGLLLQIPMECILKGAKQFKSKKKLNNEWDYISANKKTKLRRHYPNVDVYTCNHCGNIIILEQEE